MKKSTEISLTNIKSLRKAELNEVPKDFLESFYDIVDVVFENEFDIPYTDKSEHDLPRDELLSTSFLKREYLGKKDMPSNEDGNYYLYHKLKIGNQMLPALIDVFPRHSMKNTGSIFYKPGNYMGWHTNSVFEGIRIYMAYCDEGGKSFFRYYDSATGKTCTDYDVEGINIRIFEVSEANPFWHCVSSDCNRISLGFYLNENLL